MADFPMDIEKLQENAAKVKSSFAGTLGLSIAMTAVAHPLTYVKVLIQVGHEPIAPIQTTTFFGQKVWRLPNLFQYVGHIRSVDGWFGLYRGLGPRIVHNIVSSSVTNAIVNKVKEENEANSTAPGGRTVNEFMRETGTLAVAKTAGCVVSYPFYMISVRMMVQFIGRETEYSSILSSFNEIYKEDGIAGFFKGIVPHLLGELFALWLFRTLNYFTIDYLLSDEHSQIGEVRNYSQAVSQYVSGIFTYAFGLVTNLMAINGTCLAAGNPPLMPIYCSWRECWTDLGRQGLRSRGSTLFRRALTITPA